MERNGPRVLCASLVVFWCLGVAVGAQVGGGTLTGIVVDVSGASLPGASVTATETGTTLTRTAVTASDGGYSIPGLRPGLYVVHIELGGFRRVTHEGVRVATGDTTRLDASLQVGALSETMTVTADSKSLRGDTSGLGQVVDNGTIDGLPLNGRSFITLAGLAPGVALPPGSSLPRINGGRPRTNEYLFDGISVLQPEPGQVAFFPNVDAIQEFKIESNSPPAEFGRFNGGVVNLTTKSGSNAFHGTRFEFFRHEALNARNFFASANPVKPQFRRNQFGGVVGGPIRRDRTFFFARLPGTAADDRPHGDLDGADGAAAAGRLHRGHRRPCAGDLRPGDDRAGRERRDAHAVPGNAIPVGAHRCGRAHAARALSAADQRPAPPTTTGGPPTRRSIRISSACASISAVERAATGCSARLTRFRETFIPVTPLPDGSGVTTGTLGPAGHHRVVLRVELSARVLRFAVERAPRRRHAPLGRPCRRHAPDLGLRRVGPAGHSRRPREFPDTLPTFLIGGYQQLGSPPNTATDFGTSVTQIADTLTWAQGTSHPQGRRRPALGTPERRAAAVADRLVHVQQPVHRSARHGEHRHAVRQLPARPGAAVLDRPAERRDPQPGVLRRVLRPGRLAGLGSPDGQRAAFATR